MESKNQTFNSLAEEFFTYLRSIPRSEKTIKSYDWVFRKVKAYMDQNRLEFYDRDVEEKFLAFYLGKYDYSQLSATRKVFVNKVGTLTEFMDTGTIVLGKKKPLRKFLKAR